ncbi:MAG TPA: acyl-CoA dehydrogenase family protein [Candidatus Thermoplasmatota archaeon]|nr:acyl-CoA dehydrogenase family protein [Candidatus Thermoplasmatota archaeon]
MAIADDSGAPFLEPRHDKLLARCRTMALKRLEPLNEAAEEDRDEASRKAVRILASEGLLKLLVPKAYGGASAAIDHRAMVAAREGIAYASAISHSAFAVQGLGAIPIAIAGSEEQKREWLPQASSGRMITAFALTEPEAGSDVGAIKTRATRTARGWTLSGSKMYISNAGIADIYTVFAKTKPDAGHRGISAFLVRAGKRGLKVEPQRMLANLPIGVLKFKDVKLREEDLLGKENEGFYTAMRTLDSLRPTVAAAACGVGRRALDEAVKRAKARRTFGQPIGQHQGVRWMLADGAVALRASRLLTYRAAWLKDQGQERVSTEAAEAKLFATETAQRLVDTALQVHGAAGAVRDSVTAQMYREIRALRVYEGTSEILREVVGSKLLHGVD